MGNIVAIAVEKVQRYIFQKIDNNQKDRKTLRDIIDASNQVAETFLEEIKKEFNVVISSMEEDGDTILWISGKVVFRSELSREEIYKRCKRLFEKIYRDYQGHIFLKYAVFEDSGSEMENLRQSDRELKESEKKAMILQENQKLLFQFTELENTLDRKRISKQEHEKWEEVFIKNMDDLVVQDEKHESDSTDGKIAIVKADINHLGRIMMGLDSFDLYKKISKLLEDEINIENFGKRITSYSEKIELPLQSASKDEKWTLNEKILPFYIAGDDIFYATRIDSVIDSIKVLRNMIGDLNEEIQKQTAGKVSTELSLAVGVVFVNNHQPIRYYRQLVEEELAKAKTTMKMQRALQAAVGISMAGNSFHIYKKGYGYKENDGFYRFEQELSELKDMLSKKVFTNTALHNLLINMEIESDKMQQLYYALYFLRPNLQKGQLVNDELCFKYYWLSHIVEKGTGEKGQEEKDFDTEKINNVLIPKIKLVLLMLRKKYSKPVGDVVYQYIKPKNTQDWEKNMHSVMLNKPLNHLLGSMNKKSYKHNKKLDNQLVELFIKAENKNRKQLYPSADFQPSVFYRAKNLIENGKTEAVVSLFENYNQGIQQKMVRKEENLPEHKETQNELENPHRIAFDIESFNKLYQQLIESQQSNGTQWLDTLILAFYYNQQRIIVKTVKKAEKEKKENQSGQKTGAEKGGKGKRNKEGNSKKKVEGAYNIQGKKQGDRPHNVQNAKKQVQSTGLNNELKGLGNLKFFFND